MAQGGLCLALSVLHPATLDLSFVMLDTLIGLTAKELSLSS